MITADNFADVLAVIGVVAWPVVAIVFLTMFADEIRPLLALLQRLRWFKTPLAEGLISPEGILTRPSGAVEAETPLTETASRPPDDQVPSAQDKCPPQSAAGVLRLEKTGNLYWAASDLTWTLHLLVVGASKAAFADYLGRSLYHVKELGITAPWIAGRLDGIKQHVEQVPPEGMTEDQRLAWAALVGGTIRDLGDVAAANQPGYGARPGA